MAEESPLDCPVCGENYDKPKLLACNHVVCRKCVVDWLLKTGQTAGCPLCRAPILSPSSSQQDDLDDLVDALPTDLTIVAKVESHKLLTSHHVCMLCDNNMAAISFCLQCNMKLCRTCSKSHKRIPSLKNHVVEDLSSLTPERLAEINRSNCKNHDRLAELYCSAHQELLCMLCATTDHRHCTEVKAIKKAATEKRKELSLKAKKLREKETAMRTQIKKAKDKFAAMRAKANDIFDNLQRCVERRRQEVNDLIQAEEDKMALAQLDQDRAAHMSQAGVLDNLVESAPDDALLDMGRAMMSRLDDLERQTGRTNRMKDPPDVRFDSRKLTQLKSDISTLGQLGHQPPPRTPPPSRSTDTTPTPTSWPTPYPTICKPERAELARVLKVGDRVKLGRDCPTWRRNKDVGGRGTVTAIPSQFWASEGMDPTGKVDVIWDSGREGCYRMGQNGCYDLDLA